VNSWLERRRIKRRAGASALREYQRLTKQWHRENRKLFVVSLIVVTVTVVVLAYVARHHLWGFVLGAIAGAMIAGFAAVWASPPAWIENYQRGAWGEQRTAGALAPLLKQGWVIIHDLPRTKSNLDHVLIGPAGVFVLDTKNFRGTASANRDMLSVTFAAERSTDYSSDKLARSARAQGAELNQVLKLRWQTRVWVAAVVVLWTDFPQQLVEGDRMTYVHGDHLVEWLLEQPARLNAKQIDTVSALLRPGQRRRTSEDLATAETVSASDLPT
jgi:hypothetical protein